MKEDDITVAVRSLNAAFQTGFDLIEQCLAVDSMEHGVLKAVQAKMDLELTKLWKLTVLKNITPSVNSSNRNDGRECAGCGRERPLKYTHGTCSPLCCRVVAERYKEGK